MLPYIAEFLGTALLILLGGGVCANVNLRKSGMYNSNSGVVLITIAWGLAVLLPAFIFGKASGAHFNPALTIALAVQGSFAWSMVPGYIICQIAGGFAGGCLVFAVFRDHFNDHDDPNTKLGCFCTAPSIRHYSQNVLSEAVGTFVLVFAILGINQVPNIAGGLNYLLVFGIIVSIGMSLGGLTGYAINPARDLGPRLAHFCMPIHNKRDSDWGYAWVPIVGPIIGGIVAALVYNAIPWN